MRIVRRLLMHLQIPAFLPAVVGHLTPPNERLSRFGDLYERFLAFFGMSSRYGPEKQKQ